MLERCDSGRRAYPLGDRDRELSRCGGYILHAHLAEGNPLIHSTSDAGAALDSLSG